MNTFIIGSKAFQFVRRSDHATKKFIHCKKYDYQEETKRTTTLLKEHKVILISVMKNTLYHFLTKKENEIRLKVKKHDGKGNLLGPKISTNLVPV